MGKGAFVRSVGCLLVVFCLTVAGLAPALGADEPVIIVVKVLGPDGKPIEGINVTVSTSPTADHISLGKSDKDGNLRTDRDRNGIPLEPDVYHIHAYDGEGNEWDTVVYAGRGSGAEIRLDATKHWTVGHGEAEFLRQDIAVHERLAAEETAAAEAFARDHRLRVSDMAGAKKDLARIEKLPADLQDAELKNNLKHYIQLLQFIDYQRTTVLPEAKKRLAELDAESRKHSMVPSGGCPNGQGGGLLAGALSSVFDSDIAGACGEDQTKGTHGKGGKEREHGHRD